MSEVLEQIQTAYAADQERGFRKVMTVADLPRSYEELTENWLTEALCGGVSGARVTSLVLGPPDNGSSNRRRITVGYNEAGVAAGLPEHLFCKASHDLANRMVLGVSGGAKGEVDFYNLFRPHVQMEVPVAYFAAWNEVSCNSLIILDDLTDSVKSFCDDKTPMSRERAESQMRLLARLHASGYASAEVKRNLGGMATWENFYRRSCEFGLESGVRKAFHEARDVLPASIYATGEDGMWDRMMLSVARHAEFPRTITHGDVHLKNWYVAGNGEMGLSDWQCSNAGHWSRDLIYTIATALTIEDRRKWDRDLIAYYLEELARHGGPKVSMDEAWLHCRQQLWTALSWWLVTLCPPEGLPDMQPRDTTIEFLTRISTAMDDMDSATAFD
jgi:aminoglycoside phosphotransferase (APT) family kinase protein